MRVPACGACAVARSAGSPDAYRLQLVPVLCHLRCSCTNIVCNPASTDLTILNQISFGCALQGVAEADALRAWWASDGATATFAPVADAPTRGAGPRSEWAPMSALVKEEGLTADSPAQYATLTAMLTRIPPEQALYYTANPATNKKVRQMFGWISCALSVSHGTSPSFRQNLICSDCEFSSALQCLQLAVQCTFADITSRSLRFCQVCLVSQHTIYACSSLCMTVRRKHCRLLLKAASVVLCGQDYSWATCGCMCACSLALPHCAASVRSSVEDLQLQAFVQAHVAPARLQLSQLSWLMWQQTV